MPYLNIYILQISCIWKLAEFFWIAEYCDGIIAKWSSIKKILKQLKLFSIWFAWIFISSFGWDFYKRLNLHFVTCFIRDEIPHEYGRYLILPAIFQYSIKNKTYYRSYSNYSKIFINQSRSMTKTRLFPIELLKRIKAHQWIQITKF